MYNLRSEIWFQTRFFKAASMAQYEPRGINLRAHSGNRAEAISKNKI